MTDTKTTLTWVLKDEVSGSAKKMDDVLGKTSGRAQKFGAAMKVAALGAAAIGVAAIGAGVQVFKMGSQFEAMDAKAETVFGGSLNTVKKWAETNAAAMGLTRREATGLAANMGDLLIPMGFTRDQAAKMSTDIVGLSGALSEWSGGTRSAAEVSTILQKSLLGERDGLKELGISISEADVQAQLLKDGTSELTGEQLAQAKASATQTLLFAKSTDAQAAYQAGTAKGIRSQHELTAKFNEAKEALVTALYPILVKVTGWIAENLPHAIKIAGNIFNWLGKNVLPPVVEVFKVIIATIGVVVDAVKTLIGWIRAAIGFFADMLGLSDQAKAEKAAAMAGTGTYSGDRFGTRASGGPVTSGQAYLVGEEGPEMLVMGSRSGQVIPNGGLSGAPSGFTIQGVSESQIIDMVDRGLYFKLQRAAPTLGRT